MNDRIFGNQQLLSTMEAMAESGRTAHSLILYGEKGSGRRTIAAYYAKLIMCRDKKDGKPCGVCSACRTIADGANPDVIYPQRSGKLGGYSVETVASMAADAFVKPNNSSGAKVYIFTDCDNFDIRPQNKLLKLIEEPPDYAFFIFTAKSKSAFLATIISRCVCFGVSPCTEDETREALELKGAAPDDINRAVSCFHGNIGRCLDYINDESLRSRVDLTKSLADSIIRRDEYSLNSVIFPASRDRNEGVEILSMLDLLVRDAAVLGKDSSAQAIGCCKEAAQRLSEQITAYQAARMHMHIEKARRAIDCNVSMPLVLASLCADIMDT
ncbi:MAG: DNA polymerase III subunit delta' [Ruminococcus sp.]|nr:DNA polymerase III subunit delta' [Ruminococcus sp.]